MHIKNINIIPKKAVYNAGEKVLIRIEWEGDAYQDYKDEFYKKYRKRYRRFRNVDAIVERMWNYYYHDCWFRPVIFIDDEKIENPDKVVEREFAIPKKILSKKQAFRFGRLRKRFEWLYITLGVEHNWKGQDTSQWKPFDSKRIRLDYYPYAIDDGKIDFDFKEYPKILKKNETSKITVYVKNREKIRQIVRFVIAGEFEIKDHYPEIELEPLEEKTFEFEIKPSIAFPCGLRFLRLKRAGMLETFGNYRDLRIRVEE